MPEPADRDLTGHRDGGRVDQLLHAGADEGDAEQAAVVLVDDRSTAATLSPAARARSAMVYPTGPAPMTITSYALSARSLMG